MATPPKKQPPPVSEIAPEPTTDPVYGRADKVRAIASLALGLILIGIAVDVLLGGRLTGRTVHADEQGTDGQ